MVMPADEAEVNNMILEKAREKKLKIEQGSILFNQLKEDAYDPRLQPAVQALRLLLVGYDRLPWYGPRKAAEA